MKRIRKEKLFAVIAVGQSGFVCRFRGSIGYQVRNADFSFLTFQTDFASAYNFIR